MTYRRRSRNFTTIASAAEVTTAIEKVLVEWLRSKGYLASDGAKPTKGKPK